MLNPRIWKDTITVYLYNKAPETYTRIAINNAFWNDGDKSTEQKQGTRIRDGVSLFIPYTPKLAGLDVGVDRSAPYIVRGNRPFEFNKNNDIVNDMRLFENAYKGQFFRPKDVKKCCFGSRRLWHFEVVL